MCSKAFKSKRTLECHIKGIHSQIKNHACDLCELSFSFSGTLKIHKMMNHSDEQTVCDICDKTFKSKIHLGLHIRSYHGDQKIKCDLCNSKYLYKSGLKYHVKNCHEIPNERLRNKGISRNEDSKLRVKKRQDLKM